MKRFKSKKKKNFRLLKIIVCLLIIFITYKIATSKIFSLELVDSNEEFILSMLEDSNHHMVYENKNSLISKLMKYVLNINVSEPETILQAVFKYEEDKKYISDEEDEEIVTEYISDPEQNIIEEPVVYIYNTHQLENYNLENYSEYNITPNVQMAAYFLRSLLNDEGINTIVETANINDFLSLNGWSYSYSYKASRYYVEDTLKNNPNLKLLIDLHRDSLSKEKSTVTIDGKNYAKVLFVVGTDYINYEENLSLANTLNESIIAKYPTLSRGVITKGGAGVNGVYNQDLSNKIVLIECGGNENTIDEVMNTLLVLKDIIKEYVVNNNG